MPSKQVSATVTNAACAGVIGATTTHLAAIMNSRSGRFSRSKRLYEEVASMCAGRATLHVATTEEELLASVQKLPLEPNLEVAILGGDGTHMRVMSALHSLRGRERLPVLVSIPFGTVNTTNHRWHSQGAPLVTLSRWLQREPFILRRQRSLSITVDGAQEFIACTVGTGLVAQFFEAYEQVGGGPAAAARIAVQSFFGSFVSSEFSRTIMRPTPCAIAIDGRPIPPKQFSLVVCSVFKDVGLGIKVTYRAGNAPDKVALVTSSLPASKLGPQFWRVLTGRALQDPDGVDCLAREWSIAFYEHGPLIVDGDRFSVNTATIRPGPVWSVLTPS